MIIQVKKDYEVTREDIVDILSALDCRGWYCTIGYDREAYRIAKEEVGEGSSFEEVLEQILQDGGILQFVDSDNCGLRYDLTLKMLLDGIKDAIEKDYYPEYNWHGDGKLDTCMIDADVADVILQLGLFSEVMFG
jgi:hypothetical protein|nr:MAG TPA: Putative antitoxin [Caudoviricetes sp.]